MLGDFLSTVRTQCRRFKAGLISILIAFGAFLATQSGEILNPARFGFMWGSGDIASSFTSWLYFKQSALLQWPLTLNPNLGSPWSRGILFTDTPPLIAIPLKYILHGVSAPFQFTGLQVLISTCLLVYFTAKCLTALGAGFWIAQAAGLLMATAPFLIFRDQFHHFSLNILWILPAGVYLVARQGKRFPTAGWTALVFIALTWMPYFVVPVVMLWIPSLVTSRRMHPRSLSRWLVDIFLPLLAGYVALVLDGFWFNSSSSGDFGIGYYNANLLSLINPMATTSSVWSRIVPVHAVATDGQYEGFAFIGIGGLLLAVASAIAIARNPRVLRGLWSSERSRSLVISTLVAFFAATALSFDLGTQHIFAIYLPDSLASAAGIFRSSGRFMLLASVILLIGFVATVCKGYSRRLALGLVVAAVLMTYVDSFEQIRVNISQQQAQPQFPAGLTQAHRFLNTYANLRTHVTFIPPEDSAYQWKMDVLGASALRDLPTNDAFSARPNLMRLDEERARTAQLFSTGRIPPSDIWVIYPEFALSHLATLEALLRKHCWIQISGAYLVSGATCLPIS